MDLRDLLAVSVEAAVLGGREVKSVRMNNVPRHLKKNNQAITCKNKQ